VQIVGLITYISVDILFKSEDISTHINPGGPKVYFVFRLHTT